MIKLPTYHHPYRGTVPFHQSVHPSLRGGASRSGKPLSGSTSLERQPTPVTARRRKPTQQTPEQQRSFRSCTHARQFECFFAATRRKNVSRTLVVTAFSPITSRYTLLTSRTRSDVRRLPDKKISSVRVVFRSNAQKKCIGNACGYCIFTNHFSIHAPHVAHSK